MLPHILRTSNENVVEYGYRARTTNVQGTRRFDSEQSTQSVARTKPRENARRRKGFFRLSFLVLLFRRCSRIFAGKEEPCTHLRVCVVRVRARASGRRRRLIR